MEVSDLSNEQVEPIVSDDVTKFLANEGPFGALFCLIGHPGNLRCVH